MVKQSHDEVLKQGNFNIMKDTQVSRYPRYTSYPVYPFWNNNISAKQLRHKLMESGTLHDIDLYIHIPFCKKPCYYCGCNKIIAKQGTQEEDYVDYLIREWKMYKSLSSKLKAKTIHFGGGTPTFLSSDLIEKLLFSILGESKCSLSIEIDPRITDEKQIKVFKKYGAKKISMGIQDFSQNVQKVINRVQPEELVANINDIIRRHEIEEINFDLIYGLPAQNKQTIDETIRCVARLNPDTISLFSYAHIPSVFPLQARMEKHMNTDSQEKDSLYYYYKEKLLEAGYEQMGLDHFTKKKSHLYQAYMSQAVGRNFMGYTTQETSRVLGLGVSAISSLNGIYYQNEKEIKKYYQNLDEELIPIMVSHEKSKQDHIVSQVMESLMCYKNANMTEYLSFYSQINGSKNLEEFLLRLDQQFIRNKICKYSNNILTLNDGEELNLRKLCYFLDPYFQRD